MTVSLSVADLLRAPAVHQRGRVVVTGILYLDEQLGFRIFQRTDAGYDERLFLEIDDREAAAKVRAALVAAGQAPAYLGPGLVDGHGRPTDDRLVVGEVVTVHVGDVLERAAGFVAIEVRPSPWAR